MCIHIHVSEKPKTKQVKTEIGHLLFWENSLKQDVIENKKEWTENIKTKINQHKPTLVLVRGTKSDDTTKEAKHAPILGLVQALSRPILAKNSCTVQAATVEAGKLPKHLNRRKI